VRLDAVLTTVAIAEGHDGAAEAKDCAARPGADRRAQEEAERCSADRRDEIDRHEATVTIEHLDAAAKAEERHAVHREMNESNVEESRRNEPPELPRRDQYVVLSAKKGQNAQILRPTGQLHR
jgi:hypothetical protein